MSDVIQLPLELQEADLEHTIAEGLWGRVYKIRDADCVVKVQLDLSEAPRKPFVPLYDRLGDFYAVERTALSRLQDSQHFAQIVGEKSIRVDGEWKLGLLLQFYRFGTLEQVLMDNTSTIREVCKQKKIDWISQVIDALLHMHSKSIIHGDFGIQNILVDDGYGLHVADFAGSSVDGSMFLLEPHARYHRPQRETWRDIMEHETPPSTSWTRPSVQSDICALGMVMYELATSVRQYTDMNRLEVRDLIMEGRYPDIEAIESSDLRAAIQKCWALEYGSVDEIAKDLAPVLNQALDVSCKPNDKQVFV